MFFFLTYAYANEWDEAAEKIKYLKPTKAQGLPSNIAKTLDRDGCVIPQANMIKDPHNFIKGEFFKKGQIDWAILCSKDGKSKITVIWGDPSQKSLCPSELEEHPIKIHLQSGISGEIEYSRMIDTGKKQEILRYHKAFGGSNPPADITHLGIEDHFLEKASEIHYCYNGKWLKLTGAD